MAETGSTRMNISIPTDLKQTMDGAQEGVNWSAVAAEAFRAKLLDLQANREGTTMEEVIVRMKAAAEREANQDRKEGRAAGERWAKKYATPRQLKRLETAVLASDYRNNNNGDARDFLMRDYRHGLAAELCLVFTGDKTEANDYWERTSVDPKRLDEQEAYAEEFVEAALNIWSAVEKRL